MDNEQSLKIQQALRALPSVDRVLRELGPLQYPAALVTSEVRAALDARRQAILAGSLNSQPALSDEVSARLRLLLEPSLKRVINATGVVLHTNLGRAPLPEFVPLTGYSNLEYDLEAGKRGKRDAHTSALLQALLSKPAIVVNNNAAAVYLVLHELARGREVLVSRGELIEIGDGFRIPDIMAQSGAELREVGTTNRTRIDDYARAIGEGTALIMRVHPSNFSMSGFSSRPELGDLTRLGRERGVLVYEDLGSGCLADLGAFGVREPLAADSLTGGVDVISFSGDKLMGGPQCGIIAGDTELIASIRRNPMYRALRVDKLILEVLETTLRHLLLEQWEQIPAMKMIRTDVTVLQQRALKVAGMIRGVETNVRQADSTIGGGSTPDQVLPSWVVELLVPNAARTERRLRQADLPVVARIENDRVILDMRTVADSEVAYLISTVNGALR